MCDLTSPIYNDPEAARKHLEDTVWPDGPVCPHCGVLDKATLMEGKAHRPGLYNCRECRRQFSVTVGTVFERSKVPLNKWILATHLMASSKKGFSAHQLHRTIGVTYKTAWFMFHRLREAMKPGANLPAFGSGGGNVEADETFIGTDKAKLEAATKARGGRKPKRGWGHKNTVFTLVERGGKAKSFHITGPLFEGIKVALKDVSRDATLQTDEASLYRNIGKEFAAHETVNHSVKEYVRGTAYTNTVESFFSVFKRGMKGVYQHCTSDHLQRYLTEFDFRYNHRAALGIEDSERAEILLRGAVGRRLTYRWPHSAHA